jgi:hypothetical protein
MKAETPLSEGGGRPLPAPYRGYVEQHLTLLAEGQESFIFCAFDDTDKGRPTAFQVGTIEDSWRWIESENLDGLGIFVPVNQVQDGVSVKPPNDQNIAIRAVWRDLDGQDRGHHCRCHRPSLFSRPRDANMTIG